MQKVIILSGKRLTLRPVRPSDAPLFQHHITQKTISQWMFSLPKPYPPNGAIQHIRKSRRQMKKGTDYSFAILLNKQLIGTIGLHEIDPTHKGAKIGYWLAQDYWGRGLMSEALQLVLRFAFSLGLHRVYASAFVHNHPSRRVLEKAGFHQEGLARQSFWDGKWRDVAQYGLLKEEFAKPVHQKAAPYRRAGYS